MQNYTKRNSQTDLRRVRITQPVGALFQSAAALYERAFPPIERRDLADCIRILADGRFHMDALVSEGNFAGIAFYWLGEEFLYFEHFAIEESLRGRGLGGAALALLRSDYGKNVVLEIEPPEWGATATRRKSFYEREGFALNSYRHVQLKYRAGDGDCELRVMSSEPLTQAGYAAFRAFLDGTVAHA
ncbi:MAG: N-acetyltransferase [Clostridia bacterium]|nr:N-acetyltransferase [Clostridia bacterium]